MRISVIIPVYNVERYLARCLDSVLAAAEGLDCEIICVNDGSTDGSAKILDDYRLKVERMEVERLTVNSEQLGSERLTVNSEQLGNSSIVHRSPLNVKSSFVHRSSLNVKFRVIAKENGGLGSARNAGLDAMTGDYVTFVDSDDWIPPHALATFAAVAEASGAALVVSTSFTKSDRPEIERLTVNSEQLESERLTVNSEQLGNSSIVHRSPLNVKSFTVHRSPLNVKFKLRPAAWISGRKVQYCAWNKFYRADLFKTRRYPATIYEDFPITTDIIREVGEFAAVDEPLYVYCTNAGATSLVRSAFTERKLRDSMTVVRMTLESARGRVREDFSRRQAADGLSSTVGQVYKSGDTALARLFLSELCGLSSEWPTLERTLTLKAKWRLWKLRRRTGGVTA